MAEAKKTTARITHEQRGNLRVLGALHALLREEAVELGLVGVVPRLDDTLRRPARGLEVAREQHERMVERMARRDPGRAAQWRRRWAEVGGRMTATSGQDPLPAEAHVYAA